MSTAQNRVIAALKLPLAVPALLKIAAAIVTALTNNAFFPNAGPLVAALTKALTALDGAETATKTRAKGTVEARNAARTVLIGELQAAKNFVQQAADLQPEQAAAMINSAGMSTRKATAHHKAPFIVKQGPTSGSVKLVAKAAAARASYDWEWSADGGKTWVELPSTLQAKTTLAGVASGLVAQFRFRAVTKGSTSDWSQAVAMLVK